MQATRLESPTIKLAAVFLGVLALVCVGLIGILSWSGTPSPDALAGIAGGAVGALATLLTTFTPSPIPGGRRVTDAESLRRQRFDDSVPATGGPAAGHAGVAPFPGSPAEPS